MFEELGFKVTVTGRTNDGGIDGIAEMPLVGIKVALQAKKWRTQTVGVELAQRLIGSVVSSKCQRGMLITTSDFSVGAREIAGR